MTTVTSPAFTREAPNSFMPPEWAQAKVRLAAGQPVESKDGFSAEVLGPAWWKKRGIVLQFPSEVAGTPVLNRGDLFTLADQVDDSDESLLQFLWHVLAWGSGKARRNNGRRFTSCQNSTSLTLMRTAFEAARESHVREAYSPLVEPGGARIPWLGPAFFSKFLYFANGHRDIGDEKARCLILDARVASSLYKAGWSMAPTYKAGTRNFSYNWYTDTYVSYCQLLESWTKDVPGSTADMFERALFQGPDRASH